MPLEKGSEKRRNGQIYDLKRCGNLSEKMVISNGFGGCLGGGSSQKG